MKNHLQQSWLTELRLMGLCKNWLCVVIDGLFYVDLKEYFYNSRNRSTALKVQEIRTYKHPETIHNQACLILVIKKCENSKPLVRVKFFNTSTLRISLSYLACHKKCFPQILQVNFLKLILFMFQLVFSAFNDILENMIFD